MSRYLDPRADLTFKRVFGEHKELLISFLNAMLPLNEENYIVDLEYLSPELVPVNPAKKDTVVDVRCKDKDGRQFLVEMQMYWTDAFIKRALLNTCKAYSSPAEKGAKYTELKPVYSLSLVNDIAFPEHEEYYHCYKLTHTEHTEYTIDDILMVFIELPKFSPRTYNEKKMHILWLRYLTEIDERTQHIDDELLQDENVGKAIELVRESAYTDAEIYTMDKYWDAVSRERTALDEKYDKGIVKGREEGRAEGEAIGIEKGRAEVAKSMLSMGMTIDVVSQCAGLTEEQLAALMQ